MRIVGKSLTSSRPRKAFLSVSVPWRCVSPLTSAPLPSPWRFTSTLERMPSHIRFREDNSVRGDEFPGTSGITQISSDSPESKRSRGNSVSSDVCLSADVSLPKAMSVPDTPQTVPPGTPTVGPTGRIHKAQYVRLLEQSLFDLGFKDVAAQLELKSGVHRVTPRAEAFELAVIHGEWNDAVTQLKLANDETRCSGNHLEMNGHHDDDLSPKFAETTLLCLESLYEDQIRLGDSAGALATLQTKIAPLFHLPGTPRYEARLSLMKERGQVLPDENFLGGANRLHGLAALLLFHPDATSDPTKSLSGAYARKFIDATPGTVVGCVDGLAKHCLASAESKQLERNKLVLARARVTAPRAFLPPVARLETLVEQALATQTTRQTCHNVHAKPASLYRDYECGEEQLPISVVAVLDDAHEQEVWTLAFDHTGTRLATASKDGLVVVWEIAIRGESDDGTGEVTRFNFETFGDNEYVADVSEPSESGEQSSESGEPSDLSQEVDDAEEVEQATGFDALPEGGFVSLPLTHVSWSKDASQLVVCGGHFVKVYCALTGRAVKSLLAHESHVAGAAYICRRDPNPALENETRAEDAIMTACLDGEIRWYVLERGSAFSCVCDFDPSKHDSKIQDFCGAELHDGTHRVGVLFADRRLSIADFTIKHGCSLPKRRFVVCETSACTSLCLASDGKSALVNLANNEIHLWELEDASEWCDTRDELKITGTPPLGATTTSKPRVVFRFEAASEPRPARRFVTRSCFGGADEKFVASGDKDGRVYIWRRDSGALLKTLQGHVGGVNAVCWNPRNPFMMATAGDDKTVQVWLAPAAEEREDE